MRLRVPLVVGCLFLIGCGSNDAPAGVQVGESGDASKDASGDSGPSDAGTSPESSDGDAAFAAKSGFIGVTSYVTANAAMFANNVGASFFDGPGYSYGKGCQLEVMGACFVLVCDYTDGGDQMPPTGAVQSAGIITIGGTTPAISVQFDVGTMQYAAVPIVPNDKPLFVGGTTIMFAASGGDVPAFADSVVAPAPLTVTSPALASGTLSIDRSKDLVFSWTGSSAGQLSFNVRTINSSSTATLGGTLVSCHFDTTALTGTLPTALLQKLAKTDATTTATLNTDLSNAKEVVAGDHLVELAIGVVATKADGTPYTTNQITVF